LPAALTCRVVCRILEGQVQTQPFAKSLLVYFLLTSNCWLLGYLSWLAYVVRFSAFECKPRKQSETLKKLKHRAASVATAFSFKSADLSQDRCNNNDSPRAAYHHPTGLRGLETGIMLQSGPTTTDNTKGSRLLWLLSISVILLGEKVSCKKPRSSSLLAWHDRET
jgi:hypothetical protein